MERVRISTDTVAYQLVPGERALEAGVTGGWIHGISGCWVMLTLDDGRSYLVPAEAVDVEETELVGRHAVQSTLPRAR